MSAAASRWVERDPLAPEADETLLAKLRRALPAYTIEVVPSLHVHALGATGQRDVQIDLDANMSIEDLVGRIVASLEGA